MDHILVTGGEEEAFRDDIVQFIEVFKRTVTKVKLTTLMATEAHDEPLLGHNYYSGTLPGCT